MSTIALRLFTEQRTPVGEMLGELQLADFRERFGANTSFWTADDYERQWTRAAEALLAGAAKGAFVTSLTDPSHPGFAFIWEFLRDGDELVFHNRLIALHEHQPPFDPWDVARYVEPHEPDHEEGDGISEWRVSAAELEVALEVTECIFPLDRWGDVSHASVHLVRVERSSGGGFLIVTRETHGEFDVWVETADEVDAYLSGLEVEWRLA